MLQPFPDQNIQRGCAVQPTCWYPALLLTVVGFVLSFIAFRPGLMSYDSFYMYNQGFDSQITDWHHPFLPILMSVSRKFSNDTSLLLFFQSACLWFGIYFFAISLKNQIGKWALFIILIGFTPIILNQSGYIGKTALQTAMFLFVLEYVFIIILSINGLPCYFKFCSCSLCL